MALPHTYMGKLREVHRKNLDIKQSRKLFLLSILGKGGTGVKVGCIMACRGSNQDRKAKLV